MKDFYFCTIAAKNYLAHIRVLTESLLAHHPNMEVFWLVLDNIENSFDPSKEKMKVIEANKLKNIPNSKEMLFKYDLLEVSTALKPYFLEYLFKTYNMNKLVYLDPDILVMRNMDELNDLLQEFSIILIPHITKELPLDSLYPNELTFLKAGIFNLGFIGISNRQETVNFLSWWKKRLWHFGLSSQTEGMFVDQKWIDLVPCLFEKVHILKDPGYNVAYWNLHERKLAFSDGKSFVNGTLLSFFHFSGFEPDNMERISKYQTRHTLGNFPTARFLFDLYKNLLVKNEYNEIRTWPYSYNFFDNGTQIPAHARRVYWELGDEAKKIFGNPFETCKKNSFLKYYIKTVPSQEQRLNKIIGFDKKFKKFIKRIPPLEKLARQALRYLTCFKD